MGVLVTAEELLDRAQAEMIGTRWPGGPSAASARLCSRAAWLPSSLPVAARDPASAISSSARSADGADSGRIRSAASNQRAALDGARPEAAPPASRSTARAAASPWRADCST